MKFVSFEFRNFKGIEHLKLDLSANTNVYTLVGLNESGKTTILEAINFCKYKPDLLTVLGISNYSTENIHELIPIGKRDNFNGYISVVGTIELSTDDITYLRDSLWNEYRSITDLTMERRLTFERRYHFSNSKYSHVDKTLYNNIKVKEIKDTAYRIPNSDEFTHIKRVISDLTPNILYFPNFLFEFPERIYLDSSLGEKEAFYANVIQDVLDALNNNLDLEIHLTKRIESDDITDTQSLRAVMRKVNKILTKTIFDSWNNIFKKAVDNKEILLESGKDSKGAYLEFYIRDDIDTYRISERSLGFRWFFVYLLFTQFRNKRLDNPALFLLDEPASNLHASAQKHLLESFKNLDSVIYTTHSHFMINPEWLESTYIVRNEGLDYSNHEDYNSRNTNITAMKYKEFANKHPNQATYFQPILDVLDYAPSNVEMVPNAVFVEGKSDFYLYKYFSEVLTKQKLDYKFIPGTGSGTLKTLISLYLGWGKDFIILLDYDREGLRQKKSYIDKFGEALENRIFTYTEIDRAWTNTALEKLLSKDDKLTIQKKHNPQAINYSKKAFNRGLQELLAINESCTLDKETLTKIEKILVFLNTKFKV